MAPSCLTCDYTYIAGNISAWLCCEKVDLFVQTSHLRFGDQCGPEEMFCWGLGSDYSFTYPRLSIVMYSSRQLSELSIAMYSFRQLSELSISMYSFRQLSELSIAMYSFRQLSELSIA